jgi:choline dehydrogenase
MGPPMTDLRSSYDYIVVGAGSAGCAIAARLTEDPSCSVLLLEAGGSDDHPEVQDPSKWPTLFNGALDWRWTSAPLRSCFDRIDHVPRGKMLGGCHSHNASAWVRGHRTDFDSWAYAGCAGWSWADVLPLFKKIEDWHGPASDWRGTGGPIYVAPPAHPNPLATAFIEAGRSIGLPVLDDVNGADLLGVGYFNLTVKDGRRFSVADGYLRPALPRANLTVLTYAEADRVMVEGARCTGVEFRHEGVVRKVGATSEVILSAGVIGSPRILLLSGIGPAGELQQLGIPVVADLAGVGRNLQDHVLLAGLVYEGKGDLPPVRNNGAESTLWWKSDSRLPGPDIQPVLIEFALATADVAARLPHDRCYTICPSVVRPASRGTVTLTSADPDARPIIDVNFLSRDADVKAMLTAVELCRDLGAGDAFAPFRAREVMPGPLGRADMIDFIRRTASTYFHPTSTCAMGHGPADVVDHELTVHGIEGLRVADASIMPAVTSGNTNAPSVMIGEKLSELITRRFTPPLASLSSSPTALGV